VIAASEPIKIWRFGDAPEDMQMLSGNGGDEDWLALVPAYRDASQIQWMDEGSAFGCCTVEIHRLQNGEQVVIGSHA